MALYKGGWGDWRARLPRITLYQMLPPLVRGLFCTADVGRGKLCQISSAFLPDLQEMPGWSQEGLADGAILSQSVFTLPY